MKGIETRDTLHKELNDEHQNHNVYRGDLRNNGGLRCGGPIRWLAGRARDRVRLLTEDRTMKAIGRMLVLLFVLGTMGCDLTAYRTDEGVGVIGPRGGYFWCDNELSCSGTQEE